MRMGDSRLDEWIDGRTSYLFGLCRASFRVDKDQRTYNWPRRAEQPCPSFAAAEAFDCCCFDLIESLLVKRDETKSQMSQLDVKRSRRSRSGHLAYLIQKSTRLCFNNGCYQSDRSIQCLDEST